MITRENKMIKWDAEFSVNVPIIDEEHKKLILIINKVIVAIQENNEHEKISEVLNEMTLYALSHFKNEEGYMIEFEYPEYQQHKKEHKDFLMTTVGYCTKVMNGNYDVADDMFEFLTRWLTKHIQGSDKKYTECFNKNGLR